MDRGLAYGSLITLGRLLDERYLSMMLASYAVATVAFRMGYRGGLLTKLRKIEPRN